MTSVILRRARRGKVPTRNGFPSSKTALLLVLATVLAGIGAPVSIAANKATSQSGTQSGVKYQGDADDADFDSPIALDVDPTSQANSSLSGPDDIADSNHGCVGPPAYEPQEPGKVVNRTESYTDPKTGKRKLREVYDHTNLTINVSCGGTFLRSIVKCSGNCPTTPDLDVSRMVDRLVGSELVRLAKPSPSLFPRPSAQAPIPGVVFFYGVTDDQFDKTQEIPLTGCGFLDCATVIFRAKPIGVFFDPGDGLGTRKSCTTSGPGVNSRKEAISAMTKGPNCWVTFQKAGTFKTTLYLRYRATWTFYQWTRTGNPVLGQGTRTGLTSRRINITVHERQPVVIG